MFRNEPARKNAIGFALACLAAGCAPLAQDAAGGVTQGAVLDFNSCAKPMYPITDLREAHQGTVTLGFKIGRDGTVTESKVSHSSGFPGLDEAARVAIEKCRFKPAMKDGQPVVAWTPVQYVWSLK